MCKRFFAAILSVLFLLNIMYPSGLVEADPKKSEQEQLNQVQLIDYALYAAAGLGVIFAGSFIAGLLSDTSGGTENSTDDDEIPVKSWADVANFYFKAAEEEKRARGFTAEYYEHMADCCRCHARSESISETERYEHYLLAYANFEKASHAYAQRVQGSDEYRINSAKAAEMKAKDEKMCILRGIKWVQKSNDHYVDMRAVCAKAWGEVIGKKSSYDAYAKAKQLEYVAISPIVIASAWGDVKNDQALKESFSEDSSGDAWKAYEAFAEANRQEWLLKADQSSKEKVHDAWMQAYEKDKTCAKKWKSPVYRAFVAEAYMRAQDALKAT